MRLTFWTAFWVFILDQFTKYVVVHALGLMTRLQIDVWPPFITFRMAWNRGVNFGLFSGLDMRWVLIALAVAISAAVLYWVYRDGGSRWTHVSAGLLVGGAIGNVIDRLLYGAVADFLNMSCCGIENPYAFNVADIAIFAGAVGLVIFTGDGGAKGGPGTGGKESGGPAKGDDAGGDGKPRVRAAGGAAKANGAKDPGARTRNRRTGGTKARGTARSAGVAPQGAPGPGDTAAEAGATPAARPRKRTVRRAAATEGGAEAGPGGTAAETGVAEANGAKAPGTKARKPATVGTKARGIARSAGGATGADAPPPVGAEDTP